jgi:hypothetical protein
MTIKAYVTLWDKEISITREAEEPTRKLLEEMTLDLFHEVCEHFRFAAVPALKKNEENLPYIWVEDSDDADADDIHFTKEVA